MNQLSLYQRLGGYQAISRFSNNLLPRLMNDSQLGRFWKNSNKHPLEKGPNGLIRYLCSCAGWPAYFPEHDKNDIKITELDWSKFMVHTGATMEALQVPDREVEEIISFVISMKSKVVKP